MINRLKVLLFGLYSSRWYPDEVLEAWKGINGEKKLGNIDHRSWSFFTFQPQSNHPKINLAGAKVSMSGLTDIWNEKNLSTVDNETVNLAHRFHWLVEHIASGVEASKLKSYFEQIMIWISLHSEQKKGIAWQPYNISERICNLIVYASVAINHSCITKNQFQELQLVIEDHLLTLKDNLEYPASGIINNHVINNARALYIGGYFTLREDFILLATTILKRHLPKMIGNGGFLLEASSHYQLLLTRTILEISVVANIFDDSAFTDWIGKYSRAMTGASRRLIPTDLKRLSDLPAIGDVSPDVPFDWFDPRETHNRGLWNKIWGSTINTTGPSDTQSKDNNGWDVVDWSDWFAIAYSHPSNQAYPIGHGHRDFGSFVLYNSGYPIFIDIGRYSYDSHSSEQLIGNEAEAHSTVILNNRELLFHLDGFMPLLGGSDLSLVKYRGDSDQQYIVRGIDRPNEFKWTRNIQLVDQHEVVITDSFYALSLEGFLYFSPHISIKGMNNHSIYFKIDEFDFSLSVFGADTVEITQVSYFPSYGIKAGTNRISWIKKESNAKENIIRIVLKKIC